MTGTTFKKCDDCGEVLTWASVCLTCNPDGWLNRPMDEKPIMVNTTVADYLEDLSLAEKRGGDDERVRIIGLLNAERETLCPTEERCDRCSTAYSEITNLIALIKGENK